MERLQVILQLVSDQYQREARAAATATGQISTSAKTAGTDTAKMSSSMGSSLSSVAAVAKTAIIGGAAVALFQFGKASVEAASNLEESMNAVNVQFGTAAEGIHRLGEDSVTQFGLSERAFNEFSVRFSAFAENIANSSGRQVVDVVEEMTTRIADFASVHNVTMEEAGVIAQSTLAGETEAFRRFGGDVSAARVELKGMEMGLGDTSAELTEQEKILIRYELFMEQTEKTAGDFANTQDSLANSQKMLSANMEDFQAMLGALVVPAVADVVDSFSDLLTIANELGAALTGEEGDSAGFFGNFVGSMKTALDNLGPLAMAYQIGSDWLDVLADKSSDATTAQDDYSTSVGTGTETLSAYNDMASASNIVLEDGTAVLDAYNEMGRIGAARQHALARETELSTEQIQAQFDLIDGRLDTVDNYAEAVQAQADAQANVNQMIADNLEGTPEYLEALRTLFGANRDVKDAQLAIVEAGGLTRSEWIKQQVELGATRADAELLADELDRINAFDPEPIRFTVTLNGQTFGSIAAMERALQGVNGRQHGGMVTAGETYRVGEQNMPELLMIPGDNGRVFSHSDSMRLFDALAAGGGGGGGGTSIVVESVYAMGTPAAIAHDIARQVSLELRMA